MPETVRSSDFYLVTLIENLYGRESYRKIKDRHGFSKCKDFYLKIFKSIEFAVQETITITDKEHLDELTYTLSRNRESLLNAKSFYELDQRMIAFLTQILFSTIGYFPRRLSMQGFINKRNMWKLDDYRQIQFTQTIEQKKKVIFKAIQGKYRHRFGNWGDFVLKIYHRQCGSNPQKLIHWIKVNHPDIYIDLF